MSFALIDVCVFTGDSFIESGYVLVRDGIIAEAGPGQPSNLAADTQVMSKPGHTVLPGLIDCHTHALNGNVLAIEQPIRFGVTTVCDMHNEPQHIAKLKELAQDPVTKGRYSDFKCAGTGAIIEGGWPEPVVRSHGVTPAVLKTIGSWPKLKDPAEAAAFVDQQIADSGAEYIKLFHELGDSLKLPEALPTPSLDLQAAVVRAAHARGLVAVGHAFSYAGTMDLLRAGVDGLTHIFFDAPRSDDFVAACKAAGAHVNPTLSTCASQTAEGGAMQAAFAADPLAQRALFDARPREPLAMAAPHARAEYAYAATAALHAAGVPILVGSDSSGQIRGTAYGLGVHMELHLLVHRCGLRPEDALRGATALVADRFGFGDRGRIAAGKKADLVLVAGDAREALRDPSPRCMAVAAVWRDGVMAEFWERETAVNQ